MQVLAHYRDAVDKYLENCLELPQKLEVKVPCDVGSNFWECIQKIHLRNLKRYVHSHIHFRAIYNRQRGSQQNVQPWTNGQSNVANTYNEI
jgi:hypothetical protein